MIARYASAVTSGTFVTFALLYVMQLLIVLQPGAESEPRLRATLDIFKREIVETPVQPKKQFIPKETLTNHELPPPRLPYTGSLEPINVPNGKPAPPPDNKPIEFGVFTDGPLVALVRVAPTYPIRAAEQGTEGHVVVQFDVLTNGQVANVVIIESTNSVFDKAAIKATERFKYKPRIVDGVAIASYGIQNLFTFTLDEM